MLKPMETLKIPWQAIAGMRDIASHKYQTLRMEDVYNTVKVDFPDLQKQLTMILADVEKKKAEYEQPQTNDNKPET